uniref:KH_dom_type_1 domain-containing protein n=1 Tax=Strongyloides venezuelensis TaxID=75913 RepID=A0A0K0FRI1_STRVS
MKLNVIVPSRPLQMLAMGVSGSHKISLSGQKRRSGCTLTMLRGEVKTLMKKYNVIVEPGIVGFKQLN